MKKDTKPEVRDVDSLQKIKAEVKENILQGVNWNKIKKMLDTAYEAGFEDGKEATREVVEDWLTKAPKYRTKDNLVKSLNNVE